MIEPVAVIGGGRMGAGIAQVFAAASCPVSVVDTGRATLRAAHERAARGLRIAADRGDIAEEPDRVLARIQLLPAVSEIPDRCALAIEAVPEHPGVKRDVLIAIEAAAAESCLIASNTSSLSIGGLGAALDRPGRFLGMHFFKSGSDVVTGGDHPWSRNKGRYRPAGHRLGAADREIRNRRARLARVRLQPARGAAWP